MGDEDKKNKREPGLADIVPVRKEQGKERLDLPAPRQNVAPERQIAPPPLPKDGTEMALKPTPEKRKAL